jgi:DNA-binding SARP family transcriptional activator
VTVPPADQTTTIGVLGPIEATKDGEVLPLGGPKPRAVLAALVVSHDRVVSVAQLTEAVWGDEEVARPEHALQVYISSLRKQLEHDGRATEARVLVTQPPGYVMRTSDVELDLARFDALREQGRAQLASDASGAATTWGDALATWRGPAFADLRDLPWFERRGTHLDESRLSTEEDLCDALLSCGRHDEVIGRLEPLIDGHPYRERPRGQLMLALYRGGRQADALAVYRRTRDLLVDELGIEPGDALRRLEAAILDQDPSLDRASVAAGPGGDVSATIDTRNIERRAALVLPDGQRFALGAGPTLIGRAPEVTLQLSDNRVSRRHALIEMDGTSPLITDLGSTNGTTVNDLPVTGRIPLQAGDTISLGGLELAFEG